MTQRTSTKPALPQIKPAALRRFHTAFASWYAAHGRHDLPWRHTEDAYHIWLSEVMLQQTQVSTVLARFYHPFIARFPTIELLAEAPRETVMKAWEGLGYYRRAGYLHDAAKQMCQSSPDCHPEHSERSRSTEGDPSPPAQDDKPYSYIPNTPIRMPDTLDGLLALPGIGRNTATAILAFAYHRPVAIMEANVKRIVARIFALATPTEAQLWTAAEMLLDHTRPFDYNQAIMDLGTLICTARKPACALCPAKDICIGKMDAENYPAPKVKKATPLRAVDILVRQDATGKLYLTPRETALLGGLYGFPQLPVAPSREGNFLGDVTHVYSHFRLEGRVWFHKLTTTIRQENWHTRPEINALPLSAVDRKVLALVDKVDRTG